MVKTKELKPPAELVDAIQASDDATAPPTADNSGDAFTGDTPRTVRAHLMHEDQQKLTAVGAGAHGAVPHVMDKAEKQAMRMEQQKMQGKAPQYDRQHPGAGHAGRGDQAQGGMLALNGNARE